jgi:hypothetical protein
MTLIPAGNMDCLSSCGHGNFEQSLTLAFAKAQSARSRVAEQIPLEDGPCQAHT